VNQIDVVRAMRSNGTSETNFGDLRQKLLLGQSHQVAYHVCAGKYLFQLRKTAEIGFDKI